ncbi:transporter substrate-binding domain-containing protein [Anabaena cylindrica FACHB-243]|uniref:Amino acid ABC transporter substrate-binding protein, PAAT family n=1 Tax=Anabaena cylindrica (strain ATCC 27899 / PCC 7122) TaxID=272123 RepID=K9ZN75_ANACC|nr:MULTISPECIES: transporter substrate-binding domain-containing protein [Anabaena]AFZ59765.1 amino acid ABC transporter substrate-binding protein, PAAT family [Anabaena cylindrica PCC 7122]MBD2417169.1 transporter substrate-binding domain-containing protein [Anabaena cylindrica FACHB-243]MBY5283636.1 transporter substrate-binding domain-containing protein [Anabaena sp. CCAP 1446/1C]MBY5309415.1 transporter substrate-binding domain-containing protein [Anabaena sp. CCAP 1446/1C]MCM2405015.1 tra
MVQALSIRFRQIIAYLARKHHISLGLIGGMLVLLLISAPGLAQNPESQQPLLVATREIPPFVFSDQGKLSGFSIDLWDSIAKQMNVESKFVEYPTVADLLTAVKENKADLGISAISITAQRQENFDFSLPMLASGLQILVPKQVTSGNSLSNIWQLFFSAGLLQVIGVALVLVIIAAHIIWLSERHHPDGMIPKSYFPGIFKACWWAAATLGAQVDEMPKGAIGRILAIIWMFIAIIFVAYFTASATTELTVQQLQGDIRSINDLPGKVVATTSGSTAAAYLREKKITVSEFPKIEQAYDALLTKKAAAIVFDAPVLLFYAANEGKGKVEVVGSIFREENYGIVLPNESPYRKKINRALLNLREDGTYQALYEKWFDTNKS